MKKKNRLLQADHNCLLRHLVPRPPVAPAEGTKSPKLNNKTETNTRSKLLRRFHGICG